MDCSLAYFLFLANRWALCVQDCSKSGIEYKIVARVVSTEAAILGTAYYLFVPLSILLSRSFQPDSLMMMSFLLSLFAVVRYYQEPSDFRLVTAACISGLTLLCRPLVLFPLLGAFTALALGQNGAWKRVIDGRFLIFMAISLLPPVLYYGYGTFIADFLHQQVDVSFRPYLLLRREFWMGWLDLAVNALGYTALIAALLGASMLRKGLPRALVVGLGLGYVVFGLVYTMHIHTHGYYHAVLIPKYGLPLQYYGELTGAYWPRRITYWLYRRADERELSIQQRLDALVFSPEYFVIIDFNEFSTHHADLKEFLADNCVLVAESHQHLIYGACTEPF
jgi:4-amino-4-deoxy-L-arabinose transferase-like glycosyltransferase